jgi:CheY-like chemotaxis protein
VRILVVEDDAGTAENLAFQLRISGYEVEIARTGPLAIAAAQANVPDVVLLDVSLPGMSGYEVAAQFQGRGTAKAPLIVAVTGLADEATRRQAREAGFDLHLVKPVDPAQLEALLRRFQRAIG